MVSGKSDRIFNTLVYILLAAVAALSIFPLLYVISMSLTPYSEVIKNGGSWSFPKHIL